MNRIPDIVKSKLMRETKTHRVISYNIMNRFTVNTGNNSYLGQNLHGFEKSDVINDEWRKKRAEKILNTIALVVAFIGGLLWATGEWMVYAGLDDHPLLDPVGAFAAASGALMSLILYVNG